MNYSDLSCALYTHIFTEQYDDHDDFPIQSKQGECYKFWDTKALYTIYITSTHFIQYLPRLISQWNSMLYGYRLFSLSREMKEEEEKTYRVVHFSSIYSLEYEMDIQYDYWRKGYFSSAHFPCIRTLLCLLEWMPVNFVRLMRLLDWRRVEGIISLSLSPLFLMITLNANRRTRESNNNDDDSLLLLTHFELSLKVNRLLSIL